MQGSNYVNEQDKQRFVRQSQGNELMQYIRAHFSRVQVTNVPVTDE